MHHGEMLQMCKRHYKKIPSSNSHDQIRKHNADSHDQIRKHNADSHDKIRICKADSHDQIRICKADQILEGDESFERNEKF